MTDELTDELVDAVRDLLKAWDAQLPLGKPKVSVRFKMTLPKVRRLIGLIEESKSKSSTVTLEELRLYRAGESTKPK